MPLDEKALRKPEFVEGIRVRLGDGQEWSLPRPRIQIVPRRTPEGAVELWNRPIYIAQRQADLDAMLKAERADDSTAWLEARIRLVVGLLSDNYEIDDDALAELLPIEYEDEANRAMWRDIHGAIMGQEPKPSAVG